MKRIAIWREEQQSFWDAMSLLYRERNEKDKSFKKISNKFQISDTMFSNTVLFQIQNIFSAYLGDS